MAAVKTAICTARPIENTPYPACPATGHSIEPVAFGGQAEHDMDQRTRSPGSINIHLPMYESETRAMSFDRPALPYNGRCAFARCEICSRFDDDTIETFCSAMATKRYAAGASIPVVTGPDARALIIREGIVCVTHAFQDGRRQILELLFPGDLLLCEPQDDDDTCRIDAACDVVVCETPRDHLFERALRYPEIGRSLLSVMQDMVSRKNRQLIDLGRKRAEERVASFLLEYSRRMSGGRAAPRKMRLRIQRGTIADLLCLTRETISRSLTILREEGIIHLRYHDEVEIVDLDALWKRASGDDQAVPK